MRRSVLAPNLFRMDTHQKAVQAAIAAEIGARLGRANRSKAWLHRETGVSASAWRHYFTAFDRDLKLSVLTKIAARPELKTTAGELLALGEQSAPQYLDQFLDASEGERKGLRDAVRRNGTRKAKSPKRQERETGS